MKILFQNSKTGEIKLQIENQDDIWHIHNTIENGDLIRAMTYRRVETKLFKDKLRPERGEKRKMLLSIRAQESEYHEFTERLRISGIIEEGPQDLGQFHTLNIEIGDIITIMKEKWTLQQLERIKHAVADAKRPLITFISIDDTETIFAVLRQAGLQTLSTVTSHIPGKDYESDQANKKKEYFGEIFAELKRIYTEGILIMLGPGFTKEEFYSFTKEKDASVLGKCEIRGTGQSGIQGIQELLKSKIDLKLLEGQRAAYEIQIIEQLLEEIAKEGKYAYGPKEVDHAIEVGAIEILLVLDKALRTKENELRLKKAEDSKSKIVVISSAHEGGKKLESLGGIAGILRYKLER